MNRAITTLPQEPYLKENLGKYACPITCSSLSDIISDSKFYASINILDSFNDRSVLLESYINRLNSIGVKYDDLWVDKNNIELLIDNVKTLIKNNYIEKINTTFYKCDCGIVEIEKNKIETCNKNNTSFILDGDNIVCKICNGKCKEYNEDILIFRPHDIKLEDLIFSPGYLSKDAKTYQKTIINSYIAISRKRDTGIKINYNGNLFNLDIDFIWSTYLSTFKEKEKIVVAGNKMLYQLVIVGIIEKCLQKDNKTTLLGLPFITDLKELKDDMFFKNDDLLFLKLSILCNLGYTKKERFYNKSIIKYLNKLNIEELNLYYKYICNYDCNNISFENLTNDILRNQLNFDKIRKRIKGDKNV